MTDTAALLLIWRWPNGTSAMHEFVADGEMSQLCEEVAAHMEIVDGGVSFWRNLASDLGVENARLKRQLREAEDTLNYCLERAHVGAME